MAPVHSQSLRILHNPRYAGVYYRGRTHTRKDAQGRVHVRKLPQEEWDVLLPNSHPGYISWEQFQRNQQRLLENSQAHGKDRRHSPPGEGPALLQGIAICGVCGERMTVRYHSVQEGLTPIYVCQREGIERIWRSVQHLSNCNWRPGRPAGGMQLRGKQLDF